MKPTSQIIAENLTMSGDAPSLSFLGEELDKMVDHEIFSCYKLYSDETLLARKDCENSKEASEYVATIYIAKPGAVETRSKFSLAIE